ncbi:MAG: FYVE zinc finger domain-containing protein, partial [Pseudomonadota bacterium]
AYCLVYLFHIPIDKPFAMSISKRCFINEKNNLFTILQSFRVKRDTNNIKEIIKEIESAVECIKIFFPINSSWHKNVENCEICYQSCKRQSKHHCRCCGRMICTSCLSPLSMKHILPLKNMPFQKKNYWDKDSLRKEVKVCNMCIVTKHIAREYIKNHVNLTHPERKFYNLNNISIIDDVLIIFIIRHIMRFYSQETYSKFKNTREFLSAYLYLLDKKRIINYKKIISNPDIMKLLLHYLYDRKTKSLYDPKKKSRY